MTLDHPVFELNYLITDDDPHHVFPINIARADAIGNLKEAIKD
jgi:hypothetical protein